MQPDETVISSLDELDMDDNKDPFLTFIWGPRMGELVALEQDQTLVGRSSDCDLWVEDGAISRRHFAIILRGKDAYIADLGSTNGTLVNGERVSAQKKLVDGDKIQISRETILEFTYLDKTRQLSEKKRYEMGTTDPVTGTFNKRYFIDRLKEEFSFAKRGQRALSLMMFDIDHFKKLNDAHGHLAGDFVLQKMGQLIAKTIRVHDIFCRYGGEEFVILMRDTSIQNAVNLADRLRRIIAEHEFIYEGKLLPVTISCGVSLVSDEHTNENDFVATADQYLYQAKNSGRNRVCASCQPEPLRENS